MAGEAGAAVAHLGVAGGFKLAGRQLTEAELAPGQALQVGPFELELTLAPAAPPPAREEPFAVEATVVVAAPGGGPRARLVVRLGEPGASEYWLRPGKSRAGRGERNQLVLCDPTVSRVHAEFELSEAGLCLRDLGSTSGTRVNNRPVQEAELKVGDRIRLGAIELELGEAPGAAGAAGDTSAPLPPVASPATPPRAAPRSPAPGGRRRLALYGGAGAVVALAVGALLLLGGESGDQAGRAAEEAARGQQRLEEEETQRLVVINLTRAREALEAGEPGQARELLRGILAARPDHAEAKALDEKARESLAAKEDARRRGEEERARRLAAAEGELDRAEAALAGGDYPAALALAEGVLGLEPNQPRARHLVIRTRAEAAAAARLAEETRARDEARQREARRLLAEGEAAWRAGRAGAAVRAWEAVAGVDPAGETPESAQARARLEKERPGLQARAERLRERAQGHFKAGRTSAGLADLRAAVDLAPWHQAAGRELSRAEAQAAGQAANSSARAGCWRAWARRGRPAPSIGRPGP